MPVKSNNHLVKINKIATILPNQILQCNVPFADGETVAIESWHNNKTIKWPAPQLCTVKQGCVIIKNDTDGPIIMGQDIKTIQVCDTNLPTTLNDILNVLPSTNKIDNLEKIQFTPTKDTAYLKNTIDSIHDEFKEVFNQDLSKGYNGYYGKFDCTLN